MPIVIYGIVINAVSCWATKVAGSPMSASVPAGFKDGLSRI